MSVRRVFAVGAITGLVVLAAPAAQADTTVTAELQESNGSGVTGTAEVTATNDGGLRVVIDARGMVPGQPHAQHIHGSTSGGHFMCPTMEADADGDGLLTNEEACGRIRQRVHGPDDRGRRVRRERPRRRPDAGGRRRGDRALRPDLHG